MDNTITDIATAYDMTYDDVHSIFCHYYAKGMTISKAMYYTQLACAALAGKSTI